MNSGCSDFFTGCNSEIELPWRLSAAIHPIHKCWTIPKMDPATHSKAVFFICGTVGNVLPDLFEQHLSRINAPIPVIEKEAEGVLESGVMP